LKAFERMSCKLTPIALLAMALQPAVARADDPDTPIFSFSGFGTLGVVHSSENKADFTSSVFKPNGAGFSHPWSADVDSLFGAQVNADFTRQISAVVQVIAQQRYDNSYAPAVEWANVKYQFTPDISIRAGRVVLPVFLVSDYRKVGYANPWVRPPVEVYGLVPITNNDGVDGSYRVHFGESTHSVQFTYGNSTSTLPDNTGTVKGKSALGLSYTAEYGAATVHLAHFQSKLSFDSFKPLFDGFRQFGPEGIALAEKYDVNNKLFTYNGLGGMYDPGRWFVMAEWGSSIIHAALGKRSAWYASGGYRLGEFTPYLTYAQANADSRRSDPGLTLSSLPPFLAGPAAGLNAGLNSILGSIPVQKTVSVGGRWDFAKNADLKLQFDHSRLGAGSAGTLINIQPGFQPGGRFNVVSVTIDFVF
jgi:hypothetical protein